MPFWRLRLEDGVLRRRDAADPAGAAVLHAASGAGRIHGDEGRTTTAHRRYPVPHRSHQILDPATEFVVPPENKSGFQIYQLFQDGRAALTSVLWVVFFTSIMAIYFYNNWIPTLLNGSGLSQGEIVTITTALPFGGVVGTLLIAPVLIKLGSFRTVALGYLCAAIAMIVLASAGRRFWRWRSVSSRSASS